MCFDEKECLDSIAVWGMNNLLPLLKELLPLHCTSNCGQRIYAGFSASRATDSVSTIALAIRDTTYLLDFFERDLSAEKGPSHEVIVEYVLSKLKQFSDEHFEKFMGLAMPQHVAQSCPDLCTRLWREMDVIPLVLPEEQHPRVGEQHLKEFPDDVDWESRGIGEQAESMGRKCVRLVQFVINSPLMLMMLDCSARIISLYYKLVSRVLWRLILGLLCTWRP